MMGSASLRPTCAGGGEERWARHELTMRVGKSAAGRLFVTTPSRGSSWHDEMMTEHEGRYAKVTVAARERASAPQTLMLKCSRLRVPAGGQFMYWQPRDFHDF